MQQVLDVGLLFDFTFLGHTKAKDGSACSQVSAVWPLADPIVVLLVVSCDA